MLGDEGLHKVYRELYGVYKQILDSLSSTGLSSCMTNFGDVIRIPDLK